MISELARQIDLAYRKAEEAEMNYIDSLGIFYSDPAEQIAACEVYQDTLDKELSQIYSKALDRYLN